jgi:hypothetical protein
MTFFPHNPQDETQTRGQLDYLTDEGRKAPARGPGDRCIIIGAVSGIAAGLALGIFANPVFLIFGPIGGGVLGALAGSLLKNIITR